MPLTRHGLLCSALVVLTALLSVEARAQSEPLTSLASSGEAKVLLQEIPSVYSASKYEQKVTEAPSSVSIVTADEIKKYGYRTLADLLRSVRGFHISYDRNYSYIGLRGFSRPGDYNSRILVLVDGHRLNDSVYDGVLIGTDFLLDVDLIERVEIVRGPSSSLYGSNAFFGVVNIITKRGRDLQGPEISGAAGSFETYKGRLSYGQRWSNGLEMLLSGSFFSSAGHERLFFREFADPTTNNGVAVNNDDDQAYRIFGKLSLGDFTLVGGYVSRDKDVPTASYGTVFNDARFHTLDTAAYVELQYAHNFGPLWHVTARLFYDHYYYTGDYPYADGGTPILNRDSSWGDAWGSEVQLTTKVVQQHTFTIGAEMRHNVRQDQRNLDVQPMFTNLDDKRSSLHWALYAQDEFALFTNLTLHVGLRFDYFASFGSTLNPRLAVIYSPFAKTTLKFLYGTAFRVPNAYERFYQDGFTQKPSTDLQPETITTYELILEQYLGEYLRGTVATFYYTIDNLVTLQTDPADDLLIFRNTENITARGVELELEGKWSSGMTGRVSYTYQLIKDARTGALLTNAPQHLAKLNLIMPVLQYTLFAGLEVQYVSARKTFAGIDTKQFVLTNLTLFSQNVLLKGLELSASIYNVFDQRYSDPASEEHAQVAIPQDGRSFRLKLTYTF